MEREIEKLLPAGFNVDPTQVEHIKSLITILQKNKVAFDTSATGSGKTISSLITAAYLGYKMIVVVCPAHLVERWEDEEIPRFPQFEFQIVIGYTSLMQKSASTRRFLVKKVSSGEKSKLADFESSTLGEKLVDGGTMFIFDEYHKIKNAKTAITAAASVLTRDVTLGKNPSRVIFMSRTPGYNDEHKKVTLFLMGIADGMTNESYFKHIPGTGTYDFYESGRDGLMKLIDWVEDHDGKTLAKKIRTQVQQDFSAKLFKGYSDKEGNYHQGYLEQLFNFIIAKYRHKYPDNKFYATIGYKYMDFAYLFLLCETKKENEEMIGNLKYLQEKSELVTGKKVARKKGEKKETAIAEFRKRLTAVERLMAESIVREAVRELQENNNRKVIVSFNIKESDKKGKHDVNFLEEIKVMFLDRMPSLRGKIEYLYGDVEVKRRGPIVKSFNSPNTNIRVIIATTPTISLGIDLHDTDGRFPRTIYILPTYVIHDLVQVMGRIYRRGLKSPASVRIVYPAIYEKGKFVRGLFRVINRVTSNADAMKAMVTQDEDDIIEGIPGKPSDEDEEDRWKIINDPSVQDLDWIPKMRKYEWIDETIAGRQSSMVEEEEESE